MTELLWRFLTFSAVMAAVILVVRLLIRLTGKRYRAGTRYMLWAVIFVRLAIPFALPLPALVEVPLAERYQVVEQQTAPDGTVQTTVTPFTEYSTPLSRQEMTEEEQRTQMQAGGLVIRQVDVTLALLILWTAGAAGYLAANLGGYLFMMAKYRTGFRPAPDAWTAKAEKIGSVLGLKKIPSLSVSEAVQSPMLCGFFRPRIVLPPMELTENELCGILTHELTHYRRHDLWSKFAGMFVCALHWFNPAVHLADRWMNEEMELSCDESVLEGQSETVRSAYGSVMLAILKKCSRRAVPMTTHFRPGNRMVKERFVNIMDTGQRKGGGVWIAFVLVLCLLAGSAVACVQDIPAEVESTNLDGTGWRLEDDTLYYHTPAHSGNVTPAPVPVFVNGSILLDDNGLFRSAAAAPDSSGYRMDIIAVAAALSDDTLNSCVLARDGEQYILTCRIDGEEIEIAFRQDTGLTLKNGREVTLSGIPLIQQDQISLPPEDIALLLDAQYLFWHDGSVSYESGKPHLSFSFGSSYLLYQIPHLMFWRYPENAETLTAEEAAELAREQLILAYENTFGPFTPLTEEPASSPYPGDEVMYRWKIPNITVTGETDRFWRLSFVWDILMDKYTGEIFTHYNGYEQSFYRFDPTFPAALAFAG